MPAGVTSDGTSWVTVPITATLMPFMSRTVYSGRTGVGGALGVDVGAQVRELRVGAAGDDAVPQVRPAAVELVVAHRGCLQLQGVQHVDGGLVLGNGGREQRGADVVACGEERRGARGSGCPQLLDGAGELDGVGVDPAVEIVDAQEVQVNAGGCGLQVQAHHHGIVVAGAELVRGVVVGDVVVVAAVFQGHGLHGVDVPDVGAGHHGVGRGGGEDVVQGTHQAAEEVGVLGGAVGVAGLVVLVDVTGGGEDIDGVFLGRRS